MHRYQRWMDDYLDGELPPSTARKLEKHLQGCRACTALLAERRRLQLRLSGFSKSGGDAPERDFVQRILDQPGHSAADSASFDPRTPRWGFWLPAVSVVAVLSLVAGVLSVAWFVGADTAVAKTTTGTASSWTDTPVALDQEGLEELREEGWNCPDFDTSGLSLVAATGMMRNGEPELHLELSDDSTPVLLTERRSATPVTPASAHARAAGDAGSGTQGPLGMLAELGARLGADAATRVEVSKGKATLTLANATYSVESELTPAETERILRRILVTEHSRIMSVPDTGHGTLDRLIRGLGRLVVLDVKP
ncbi:anti-sigma factor family protein [Paeniglutamicibacter cryotolerans]|uniref:Putative zinc-finger domain-containing protein n=1 Tax=Paeniglutamicibacter cryotolerans TaxID=670079 RepID=A0A839QRA5_9MICC|nr:zf-HC2 domain-containing protein [Paeniglutamicibacter cryotolerans]MBB2996516.1 hypothetical protein [Paeniglutamicibacter cryotolerans]